MYKNILVLIVAHTIAASYPAESANIPLTLTQRQAVDYALKNNTSLIASRLVVEQKQSKRTQAGKISNPEMFFGIASDKIFNNEGEFGFEFGFEQTFPITKRLHFQKAISDLEIKLASVEVKNQERLLTEKVELVFIEVVHVNSPLTLRHALVDLTNEFASFVSSRIETGEASHVELTQINIEKFTLEQEIQELKNNQKELLAHLSILLSSKKTLTIHDDLLPPNNDLEIPAFIEKNLYDHPEFRLKQLTNEIAKINISLAQAEKWEDLSVEFNFESEKRIDEPEGIEKEKFFGTRFSLPLPMFNGNQGTIQERQFIKEQTSLEMKATEHALQTIAQKLRQKTLSLKAQVLQYSVRVIPLAEKNSEEISKAYTSGQVNLTELFRAQEQLLKTKSHYLKMIYSFRKSLIQWQAATNQQLQHQEYQNEQR